MKKGMLLSTITMLIVLALSLTTATFAWFSVNTFVKTGDVQFTAQVAKELSISQTADSGFKKEITFTGFGSNKSWNSTVAIAGETVVASEGVEGVIKGQLQFTTTVGPNGETNFKPTAGVDYAAETFFLMSSITGLINISVQFDIDTTTNYSKGLTTKDLSKNYLAAAARLAIVRKTGTVEAPEYTLVGVYAPYDNVKATQTSEAWDLVVNDDTETTADKAFTAASVKFHSFENGVLGGTTTGSIYDNLTDMTGKSTIEIANNEDSTAIEFIAYTWLEGTDNEAINALSGGIFKIRLRFDFYDKPIVETP